MNNIILWLTQVEHPGGSKAEKCLLVNLKHFVMLSLSPEARDSSSVSFFVNTLLPSLSLFLDLLQPISASKPQCPQFTSGTFWTSILKYALIMRVELGS